MRAGLLAIAIALCAAAPASAGALTFDAPFQLPHGDPKGDPFLSGGEPSIAFDPAGDGHTYVVAPQGIPVAIGFLIGSTTQQKGIAYWASDDHGRTWPRSGNTGSLIGGGDSDVEVLSDHTVLTADLQAVAAAICTSTDFAKSFPDCENGLVTKEAGPENDRQWLTRGTKPGEVYLTYHDFVAGLPLIFRSTDKGASFQPCGSIIEPGGPAAKTYTPTGGTLVSKPIVAPDGTIFVEFTTPSSAAPIGAKLNNLWMAVAKGGCGVNTVFKNYKIYSDPGADLGRIFQQAARDGSGRLYVTAAGQAKAGQSDSDMYLFTSADEGKTWSAPIKVNPPALGANVFPTVAAGDHAGEAFVGWFGTSTSSDPNNTTNQWRYYGAATYDGGQTFNLTTVTADPIHYGDICTQGLFCGLIPGQPGNRNLADFASAAVDPADGCLALAIPGDPYNRPDLDNGPNNSSSSAYVALQADRAACFTAANSGKPASEVGGAAKTSPCLDRAAPASRLLRKGRKVSRRGLVLHGRTTDRGCRSGGRGSVASVSVAIRRQGSRAQLRYVPAHIDKRGNGSVSWTLRAKRRLGPGHWAAYVRAVDKSKNVGKLVRLRFRVR
jgi:hypothetical protein